MSQWIWTFDDLKRTPSILAGLTIDKEELYRREGCKIIAEVGSSLGFKANPTISTACLCFHRFYMFEKFQEYPREITALGCLYLAGKVKETPKNCDDLCVAAVASFPTIFNKFENLVEDIMRIERVMLAVLKFETVFDLPYDSVLEYTKLFPQISIEKMKVVERTAWTLINDSYYTTICLTLEPQMIAIALLQLAFTATSTKPVKRGDDPCWWANNIANWPRSEVDKYSDLVLDFYVTMKTHPLLENNVLSD